MKMKRSNSRKVDISDWNLPVVDLFLESIKVEIFKATKEAIEAAIEEGPDVYFTIGCPNKRKRIDPLEITVGLPLGADSCDNLEFRGSLRDAVKDLIARSYSLTQAAEVRAYMKKMKSVSAGLKEMAEAIDGDIEKLEKVAG